LILAGSIFLAVLVLIIWQPRGVGIGTIAIIGAVVAYLVGVVDVVDIQEVVGIVWDATLAFIGIIILSLVLDELGFFEWSAIKMAKLSRGSGHLMFVYSLLLGSIVSALFANDGAALILTPILLSKMKILKLNTKTILSFMLAGGFISDSASLPLVFSNLTNIVTADYFHIGFLEYLRNMMVPYMASTIVSMVILWTLLRKDIPKTIDTALLPDPASVIKSNKLFHLSWIFLSMLLGSYAVGDIYHIPISFFALGGAMIFLFLAKYFGVVNPTEIIRKTPWQIVWFSIGLYIVVYGLKNAGLTDYIADILLYLDKQSHIVATFGTGLISAGLSAFMNNMPTVMIMDIAIDRLPDHTLAYANIIGCNIGPKMTPFGSLATLLWLHVLAQKGVRISFRQYSKFGLIVTPIVLLIVLSTLI
jgi:arsenical pump membrane protein